jgi:hypothetical protein
MFYANNHHIIRVLEHSRSYFTGHYCFFSTYDSTTVDSVMSETEVRLKQHAMIDVTFAEGEKPTCIFERLFNVCDYGDLGMSPARGGVRRIKEAIAGVIPHSFQLQGQVTFPSLG